MLREVRREDLDAIFAMQGDPVSASMAAVPSRDRAGFEAHWAKILPDPTVVKRVIVKGGVIVGYLVVFTRDGHRELGYWIDRAHWGRGLATAAVRTFLTEHAERPLRAVVAAHNRASRRVLEKAGFARAGEPWRAEDGVEVLAYELEA
ncbi:MAG: hypothetical protein QOE90_291 [Thermoplasmata archaeon]|jgi:RimJ/RimL family protein N-acetyltransferase|nr:hypothetical protein [Thermoplasmata archaeon]